MGQLYYYDSGSSSWLPTQVGAQGPQGNQGFQGSTGSQGNQGFQGNQGNQGNQGTQGNQGFQGASILPTSATATSAVTATAGQVTTCNPSSTFAVTLPASPSNGTICGVYVLAAATSYVTVAAGSGNTLDYAVGRLYAGQSAYLVYNSTTTSWVSPTQNNQQSNPAGRITSSAATSLTGSNYISPAMATTSFMVGGMTRSTNTIVVPIAGYYQCDFQITTAAATAMALLLQYNGATASWAGSYNSPNLSIFTGSDIVYAAAGGVFSIVCYNYGSTTTVVASSANSYLSISLVSQ